MFVVTLLTDPGNPALDPALVDALRNAWGGGEVRWLSPDEAAEFPLETVPENRADVAGTWTPRVSMATTA